VRLEEGAPAYRFEPGFEAHEGIIESAPEC
jgi:hypothetical protein